MIAKLSLAAAFAVIVMIPVGVAQIAPLQMAASSRAKPSCCIKRSYCCSVKNRCCRGLSDQSASHQQTAWGLRSIDRNSSRTTS